MERMNSRYQGIGAAENMEKAAISRDPRETLRATYGIFSGIVERYMENETLPIVAGWTTTTPAYEQARADHLYGEACNLFEGAEEVRFDDGEIMEFLAGRKKGEFTGLYLSALQNCTATEVMIIDEISDLDYAGYRLAPGKIAAVANGCPAKNFGQWNRGILLNFGYVKDGMAGSATGGLAVNYKSTKQFAEKAEGCLFMNCGEAGNFARFTKCGIHINHNLVRYAMACSSSGGFYGNFGSTGSIGGGWLSEGADNGLHVNFPGGKVFRYESEEGGNGAYINAGEIVVKSGKDVILIDLCPETEKLCRMLEKRLHTIDFLKDVYITRDRKLIEDLRKFDWAGFEKTTLEMSRKIADYVRRKHVR